LLTAYLVVGMACVDLTAIMEFGLGVRILAIIDFVLTGFIIA